MALSRGSSNGPDEMDVRKAWGAFERDTLTRIQVTLTYENLNGTPDLCVDGEAYPRGTDPREAKPLASTKSHWRTDRFKSLESVIFYTLYTLDFQLGSPELDQIEISEADPPDD